MRRGRRKPDLPEHRQALQLNLKRLVKGEMHRELEE